MTPTMETQEAVGVSAPQEPAMPAQLPPQGPEGQQLAWTFNYFYDPGTLLPEVEKEILETEARILRGEESLVDIDP